MTTNKFESKFTLKLNDYQKQAKNNIPVLTKFLDLEEQRQLNQLDHHIFNIKYEGGYLDAERKRAIISTSKDEYPIDDYQIVIFHFTTNPKLANITHRHVLGTIMSLGIERNTFGDIIVNDNNIYLIVTKEISKYIFDNLTYINHQPIILEKVDKVELIEKENITETINVASMRLDAIIASAIRVSRSEASKLIESGLVLINHQECLKTDRIININDIISIRRYGRVTVNEILNTTRKNRLMIKINRQF